MFPFSLKTKQMPPRTRNGKMGAAKNSRNVLYLSIMKGVGSGIIIDNKLYHGSRYKAGEVGHIVIKENGRTCTCGELGCLNEYISVDSLCREYSERSGNAIDELTDLMGASRKEGCDRGSDLVGICTRFCLRPFVQLYRLWIPKR